ncbi:Sec-independent protein translocase subunit TatA [Mycolicibacterium iranicum]|uniref:Sec-independent protein translocase protein TatA n=1 Tax=Mycolicibacterium iranicum TaxID=912594 RepID=A0ABT4HDB3_MYCIR|nr:Sec-independent protein translocase subunit TatA [Mycolicibacterium iranicum]MCZ0728183.1 Sec-independent protein translocase subunit TatA [Mycolicibacterium iranicum]
MGGLQPWHWLIVIAVFVLLFGAKKLPDAARSLGKSMRIFKSEIKEMQADSKSETSDKPAQPTQITSERVVDTDASAQPTRSESSAQPTGSESSAQPTSDKRPA